MSGPGFAGFGIMFTAIFTAIFELNFSFLVPSSIPSCTLHCDSSRGFRYWPTTDFKPLMFSVGWTPPSSMVLVWWWRGLRFSLFGGRDPPSPSDFNGWWWDLPSPSPARWAKGWWWSSGRCLPSFTSHTCAFSLLLLLGVSWFSWGPSLAPPPTGWSSPGSGHIYW